MKLLRVLIILLLVLNGYLSTHDAGVEMAAYEDCCDHPEKTPCPGPSCGDCIVQFAMLENSIVHFAPFADVPVPAPVAGDLRSAQYLHLRPPRFFA